MIKLDIKEEDLHPYLYEMVNYHWKNGLPFVYTNTKGQVVQQWRDDIAATMWQEYRDYRNNR